MRLLDPTHREWVKKMIKTLDFSIDKKVNFYIILLVVIPPREGAFEKTGRQIPHPI